MISRIFAVPPIQLRSAPIANSCWSSATYCKLLACISCAASKLMRVLVLNHSLHAESISDAAPADTVVELLIACTSSRTGIVRGTRGRTAFFAS
jgi:hypothetical protein